MKDRKEFEKQVKILVPGNDKWMHILHAVPEEHSHRFLDALQKGINMPTAFDLVLVSKHMTDTDFHQKLKETLSKG